MATTPASAPLSAKTTVRANARIDAHESCARLVLDHGADAAPERGGAEEHEEYRCYRERDRGGPDTPHRHRDADDGDRVPADEDVQRARRIPPREEAPDDERGSQRQQEAQERPLFSVLAVDRPHQREIEQNGDTCRRQHTHEGGENRRDAVLHEERDDDCRHHHDLPVGEVEDAAEAVDERHADAEQAKGQAEHDPVEDDRFHWSIPANASRRRAFMRYPDTRVVLPGSGRAPRTCRSAGCARSRGRSRGRRRRARAAPAARRSEGSCPPS